MELCELPNPLKSFEAMPMISFYWELPSKTYLFNKIKIWFQRNSIVYIVTCEHVANKQLRFYILNRSHGSKIGTFFFFNKIIWQRTIMFQYWSTYYLNDLIIPSYLQLICLYFILSPLILDRSPFCLSNLCCRSCTLMYIVFSVTETKKRD